MYNLFMIRLSIKTKISGFLLLISGAFAMHSHVISPLMSYGDCLQPKIDELKQEIDELKQKIVELKKRMMIYKGNIHIVILRFFRGKYIY